MLIQLYSRTARTLFVLGMWGLALNRKSILTIILAVELMLLGANFNFLVYSVFLDDLKGQIFSLLILTVAAAETSIGLAILVIFYRHHRTVGLQSAYHLFG